MFLHFSRRRRAGSIRQGEISYLYLYPLAYLPWGHDDSGHIFIILTMATTKTRGKQTLHIIHNNHIIITADLTRCSGSTPEETHQ